MFGRRKKKPNYRHIHEMEEELGFVEKTTPRSAPPLHPLDEKAMIQKRLEMLAKTRDRDPYGFSMEPGAIWRVERPQDITFACSAFSAKAVTTSNGFWPRYTHE